MKVLQVIDSGGLYGAEKVVLGLMNGLSKQGVDCRLASIGLPGEAEKPLESEARRLGFDTMRVTMKSGVDRIAACALAEDARTEGFDLLHTHGYKANILMAGMPRATRRLPAIATLHGWTSAVGLSKMRLYEVVERLMLGRAERVVSVSTAMVDRWGLRKRYKERLTVIPNGVEAPDAKDVRPLPPEVESFSAGRRCILAVGRLSKEKGFDNLLEALAIVRRSEPDVCLVIVGEGEERHALEEKARTLGATDAILMPGYLADASSLMRHFDVLAIPSHTEGLPVVLLEALLVGIPLAATAVGEIPAVMEQCGAGGCVPPGNAEELAKKIRSLLAKAITSESKSRMAQSANETYSAVAMASAYYNVYSGVLESE